MQQLSTPTLQTSRLILRKVKESDWPQILLLRSDPQVNALVKRPKSVTKEDAIAFINKVQRNGEVNKIAYWGIVLPEVDEVMGSICLWKLSEDCKTAEVGYDLTTAAQGKGYMTEAMQAVLSYGFSELKLSVIEAYTQSNNLASIKLLDRFDFNLLMDRKDQMNKLNAVYALNFDYFLTR